MCERRGESCVLVCVCATELGVENRNSAVKCTYVKERHGDLKSETAKLSEAE